ncbi:MAG: hypothetical protein AAGL29_01540 [Bacteroidota bacterium]
MKNLLFLLIVLLSGFSINAQEEPTDSEKRMEKFATAKRNELSLDVYALLAVPALNLRYERILGRFSGLGIDLFISFDNNDDLINYSEIENFSLTPYFRQYFFSKEDFGAKGFYAEGFIKFFTFDGEVFNPVTNDFVLDSFFETAIGFGIGWKWINRNGFLVDLGFGFGRNIGIDGNPEEFDNDFQPRGGLHFGWRF